ncbi:MAG: carbon-phosphorus lyase complex subunit PhnI [Candidatus Eremiobacteraeota bacterium]|nr:carbon-phosphorus lyase complex subunit PhnI [Candidatus Eremiobacteraeota bacterium]
MGYTTVADRSEAVDAAAALAAIPPVVGADETQAFIARYPLLIEHVSAEAGITEPVVCARALLQAMGDIVRAVSLVRAWGATLPRVRNDRIAIADLRTERRVTPAFSKPAGGQYLGASLDYAQRLLDFGNGNGAPLTEANDGVASRNGAVAPSSFAPAIAHLDEEGLISAGRAAEPVDMTRTKQFGGRGGLLQLLARGETGTMTGLAYIAIRGYGQRQDPTLMELRGGFFPVQLERPDGETFTVGEIPATVAEVTFYRLHDDTGADPQFTLGVGATPGRVERRAIAAAMLDAGCARAAADPDGKRRPCDDEEFIRVIVDGQEASGFVEHLKLPHYVTFTSELDRVRAARASREEDV